jgi:hypothetical protein
MKRILTISILVVLSQFSYGQDSSVYVTKCRLKFRCARYNCARLILRSDNTYHYEEFADDLPLDITDGKYEVNTDTLSLFRNDNLPTIKLIKKGNHLISLKEYSLTRKLKKIIPP